MNPRWLIRWNSKGCERWESFEFRMFAEFRMIQLESFKLKPELINLFEQPELMMYVINEIEHEGMVN